MDYVEDAEADEVLVDVSSLETDQELKLLSDEIATRYPVEAVSAVFTTDPEPREFRVYHIEKGFLARKERDLRAA